MDSNITGIIAIISIVLSFIGGIISGINHRRIRMRSPCCKNEIISSIDIENTTPVIKTEEKV